MSYNITGKDNAPKPERNLTPLFVTLGILALIAVLFLVFMTGKSEPTQKATVPVAQPAEPEEKSAAVEEKKEPEEKKATPPAKRRRRNN